MKVRKLFKLTGRSFALPAYVDDTGRVTSLKAEGIPMMSWPDGSWCAPVNLYMQRLARQGLARRNGGSTLSTYASNLSPFIRFCFVNKIDFCHLRDSQFTLFIRTLSGERKAGDISNELTRSNNQVIKIGRVCLAFLAFWGEVCNVELVGGHGPIRGEIRENRVSTTSRKFRTVRYWYHHSFPLSSAFNKRMPASREAIASLRKAVALCSNGPHASFLKKRRYVMLKLLEIFGVRRAEVAGITVQSVIAASKMANPMLEVPTVKGRGARKDAFRKIPVSRHDIGLLMEYINVNRAPLVRQIRRRRLGFVDSGFLLISSTRGSGLLPNTITQEVSLLVRTAGLTQRVCAHMFRHRFITKLFVALIQQHKFENVESLRDALAATEDFKRQVLEWTGHRSIQSLETYLHLAFDELRGTKGTLDLARLQLTLDSFCINADQLQLEIAQGLDPIQQLKAAGDLVAALKKDVTALSTSA